MTTPIYLLDRLEKIRNVLFYIALVIECVAVIIDKSRLINPYETWLFRGTAIIFLLVVFMTEYTTREWIIIALAVALGITSYLYTGRDEITRVAIFVAACKGLPLKRIFMTAFVTTLIGCLILIILAVTGTFGEISVTTIYRVEGGVATRYTLGFGHPNALQCMYYMLVLMALYLFDKYMRWYIYIALTALSLIVCYLTDSRTGLIMCLFSIIVAVIMHYPPQIDIERDEVARFQHKSFGQEFLDIGLRSRKITYALGGLVTVASVAISVAFAVYTREMWYGTLPGFQIFQRLDKALSERISNLFWNDSTHAGWIGTWMPFSNGSAEQFFDLGWVRLFYWYGYVPATIAVIMVLFLIAECYRRRDGLALMLIVSLSVYTIIEAHLISVYLGRNFLLLIFGAYWSGMLGADKGEGYYLPELIRR